VQFLSK